VKFAAQQTPEPTKLTEAGADYSGGKRGEKKSHKFADPFQRERRTHCDYQAVFRLGIAVFSPLAREKNSLRNTFRLPQEPGAPVPPLAQPCKQPM
jgi:hypothetical protein